METLPLALPALTMNGQSIKRVYSMKFLGVLLDEHLTWQAHINNVEAKVSKSIGIIAKARKYLNLKALKSLYFSFIHPYITYGNVAWASTFRTKLQKIYRLQKRAIRVMTHSSRITHSRPLMQEHSILNVYEVNILQTLSFIFKHRINTVPVIFSTWFTRIHHGYNSRLAEFGYQECSAKGQNRFSIRRRAPVLWNRIPCSVARESNSVQQFKYKIKQYLLAVEDLDIW